MSERPRWLTEAARTPADEPPPTGARPARPPVAGARRFGRLARRARSESTRKPDHSGPATSGARPAGVRPARTAGGTPGPGVRRAGVVPSRARFERRASAVRRRPWRLVGVGAGALLVVVAVIWLVWFSPLLATRTVTVTGLSDAGEQQRVVETAAVATGTPLARVDTGRAAEAVQRISTVKSVTVSRSWPSTVVVSVQRKVPVLAVKNPQGQLQVVDETGVAYESVPSLPPGVAEVNAAADAPDPEGIRAAISILQLLPAAQRAQVSGVTVTSADLVTLQLGDVSVVWGGLADGAKKLTVLQALLPTHPGVIDVSAPDTPVTR